LARAGEIVRFDADGAHAEPPLYESPHRATLIELHAALSEGSRLSYTLSDLADDLELGLGLESGVTRPVTRSGSILDQPGVQPSPIR
jgi:hypothetical protein